MLHRNDDTLQRRTESLILEHRNVDTYIDKYQGGIQN